MTDYFYNRPGTTTLATMPLDSITVLPTSDDPSIATIARLSVQLAVRRAEYDRFDAYYNGEHGLRFASQAFEQAFAKRFGKYAENLCGVIVDAVEERLDVEGFRFPPGNPKDPDAADPEAWRIWQDNGLDAGSQIAHTEALVKGCVYVLIGQFEAERVAGRSPRITIEDPSETIVEYAPGTRERVVGMKRWEDSAVKRTYATLYFPDRIEKWQTATRSWANQYGSGVIASDVWEKRQTLNEEWPLPNRLGVVPLVPLVNRPRLVGEGRSEIADILPIQDAINKIATDELVTSDAAGFPQRWATGTEIPIDPDTKKPIESYKAAVDRFLSTSAPDAKFGQFPAADLGGFIQALDQKYRAAVGISGVPMHYFQQHGGQPPSGESLRSSETRLVRKATRKQRHFGEGWEEVMRLAFAALSDPRAEAYDNEALWGPAETLTESEHLDALTKMRVLKVPLKKIWERAGFTPTEAAEFPALLADEAKWLTGTVVEPITPDVVAQDQVQERVSP